MSLLDWAIQARSKLRIMRGRKPMSAFDIDSQALPAAKVTDLLLNSKNEIEKLIYSHEGRVIHKWTHYPEIYDKYFFKYRQSSGENQTEESRAL